MVVTSLLQGWIMVVASFARWPQPCEVVTTLYDDYELVVKINNKTIQQVNVALTQKVISK